MTQHTDADKLISMVHYRGSQEKMLPFKLTCLQGCFEVYFGSTQEADAYWNGHAEQMNR
jgi:hypothetical protein